MFQRHAVQKVDRSRHAFCFASFLAIALGAVAGVGCQVDDPQIPPAKVSAVTAEASDGAVTLKWLSPDQPGFDHVVVTRQATAASGGRSSGAATRNSGEVRIYAGRDQVLIDHAVSNGTTYEYSIYSVGRNNHTAMPVVVTATPQPPASASASEQERTTRGGNS